MANRSPGGVASALTAMASRHLTTVSGAELFVTENSLFTAGADATQSTAENVTIDSVVTLGVSGIIAGASALSVSVADPNHNVPAGIFFQPQMDAVGAAAKQS